MFVYNSWKKFVRALRNDVLRCLFNLDGKFQSVRTASIYLSMFTNITKIFKSKLCPLDGESILRANE